MLAIVIALLQAGGWSHQEPPSLLTMEGGRAGWSQIEVEWSYSTQRDGRRIFYANRYAEGEWIGTELGDGTGLAPPDQNGQRMRKFPLHRLFTADGTVWQHEENSPHAVLRALGTARENPAPDLRNVGLNHMPRFMEPWQEYSEKIWKLDMPVVYREFRNDEGMQVVEARMEANDTSLRRWVLDPAKGFQPVRVEMVSPDDGAVKRRVDLTYRNLPDGSCFLDTAVYFEGGNPYAEIRIGKVRSHDPSLPKKFTVEDIDIDNGVEVSVFGVSRPERASAGFPLHYCQGELVDAQELGRRISSGKVTLGKNFRMFQEKAQLGLDWRAPMPTEGAKQDALGAGLTLLDVKRLLNGSASTPTSRTASQPASRALTAWERYTLEFIARYRLNDQQIQKALAILRECEERRCTLEARMKGRQPQQIDQVNQQITMIFEKTLKPKLDKLPTRQQRAAIEPQKTQETVP